MPFLDYFTTVPPKIKRKVGQAIAKFNMIRDDDNIMLAISGGKDSMYLALVLASLRRRSPVRFTLSACTVYPGDINFDTSPIAEYMGRLEIPWERIDYPIFDILKAREEPNPCSLCANIRRGILAGHAQKIGAASMALGHHMDDAMETAVMNLLYAGRFACFSPHMEMSRTGIRVIRPLVFVPEERISSEVTRLGIPVCSPMCPYGGCTKRSVMKEKIALMQEWAPDVRSNIMHAICTAPEPAGWQNNAVCDFTIEG